MKAFWEKEQYMVYKQLWHYMIHALTYIKIRFYIQRTSTCFGQPCGRHRGCKIRRLQRYTRSIKRNYKNTKMSEEM